MTPQDYEILTGGGAESAAARQQGLSRRQVLRRAVGFAGGILASEATLGSLAFLYPQVIGAFGGLVKLKAKAEYPVALPAQCDIENGRGVFYESAAKSYIVHLSPQTPWALTGVALDTMLASEQITRDPDDGSFWLAIYQRCVHLGCKFGFVTEYRSFKCPCHGSHYNVDGEWLGGPAPRSNDRFALTFAKDTIVVDTTKVYSAVPHPTATTRLLRELPMQLLPKDDATAL